MTGATAVVLAGSRPGRDALAQNYGTDLKALIPVAGEPMVRRPVQALLASPSVTRVHVLAQQPERIRDALPDDDRIFIGQSGNTIAATLEAFSLDPDTRWPLLVTTADHAMLTSAMVEEFVGRAEGADVAIGLVERKRLLARLPQSQRTWHRFRGGAYSGANLFLLAGPQVRPALELWRSVEQDRKNVLRLFRKLGPLNFLATALRLRTLRGTLDALGRKLGLDIRSVELSDPLAAVDVDKPADHELVTAILEGRA